MIRLVWLIIGRYFSERMIPSNINFDNTMHTLALLCNTKFSTQRNSVPFQSHRSFPIEYPRSSCFLFPIAVNQLLQPNLTSHVHISRLNFCRSYRSIHPVWSERVFSMPISTLAPSTRFSSPENNRTKPSSPHYNTTKLTPPITNNNTTTTKMKPSTLITAIALLAAAAIAAPLHQEEPSNSPTQGEQRGFWPGPDEPISKRSHSEIKEIYAEPSKSLTKGEQGGFWDGPDKPISKRSPSEIKEIYENPGSVPDTMIQNIGERILQLLAALKGEKKTYTITVHPQD